MNGTKICSNQEKSALITRPCNYTIVVCIIYDELIN